MLWIKSIYLKIQRKLVSQLDYLQKQLICFCASYCRYFFYPVGVLLAVFYVSVSDALQNGQSVGKKLMGFNVISMEDGEYCSVKQSIIRNLPLSVPLFFGVIPIWGWIIWILAGSFFLILELYLLLKLDSGNRLGDVDSRYNRERNEWTG